MKEKILITWISSWIWFYLSGKLRDNYQITWLWRNDPNLEWVDFIEYDLQKPLEIQITGKYDYIIFNAWIGYFDDFLKIQDIEISEIIQINLIANIILTKQILSNHKPQKLIYIWSIASKKFFKYWSAYSASKFWLRWFVGSLRNEIKKTWIHIINPWIVKTNFFKNSKISIPSLKETSLEEILEVVQNILNKKENRFEIDLY